MMKRIALVRVVCFCLLAACGAVCQRALPDAPSARDVRPANPFQGIGDEGRLPLTVGAVSTVLVAAGTHPVPETPGMQPSASRFFQPVPTQATQNEPVPLIFKRLYPSLLNPNLRYRPSVSDSLMGRAKDAASSIFVTRSEDGKHRFNTSYFLRVATSIAAQNASRTYRPRSRVTPLGDFGSTVGNDAGMNLWHEFGPAVRQMVTGHLPTFVSRIEQRIIR